MERTYSLINFMKAYYPDSNIPMYLFSDEKCIFCMPEQNELTYPPFQYLQELFSGSDRITHCTTEYGIMFCSLKVDSSENRHLVFGPVTTVPYSDSDLQHLYKDYMVSNDSRSDFNSFLRQIPCLSLSSLLKTTACTKRFFHLKNLLLSDRQCLRIMLHQMPLFFWKKLIKKRKMNSTTRLIFWRNSF